MAKSTIIVDSTISVSDKEIVAIITEGTTDKIRRGVVIQKRFQSVNPVGCIVHVHNPILSCSHEISPIWSIGCCV